MGNKTYDSSSKKKDFLPKNDQIWPKTGIFGQFGPGYAGLFGALLVGRLVVVARGLYLATTGDDQQVNCVISNDTQGITVFISNYRVFLHGKTHIC